MNYWYSTDSAKLLYKIFSNNNLYRFLTNAIRLDKQELEHFQYIIIYWAVTCINNLNKGLHHAKNNK